MNHQNLIIVGSAAFFAVACDRNPSDQTQTTGATSTAPTVVTGPAIQLGNDPNDTTIDRITEARCKREVACNNIGASKKWTDESACRRELRQNMHADYRQSECHVVLTDKVASCIDAIQNEKCDGIFDMTRVGACRKGNICKD